MNVLLGVIENHNRKCMMDECKSNTNRQNPNSVTTCYLYYKFDEVSHVWLNSVLSILHRNMSRNMKKLIPETDRPTYSLDSGALTLFVDTRSVEKRGIILHAPTNCTIELLQAMALAQLGHPASDSIELSCKGKRLDNSLSTLSDVGIKSFSRLTLQATTLLQGGMNGNQDASEIKKN